LLAYVPPETRRSTRRDGGLEEPGGLRGDAAERDELVEAVRLRHELADVHRQSETYGCSGSVSASAPIARVVEPITRVCFRGRQGQRHSPANRPGGPGRGDIACCAEAACGAGARVITACTGRRRGQTVSGTRRWATTSSLGIRDAGWCA